MTVRVLWRMNFEIKSIFGRSYCTRQWCPYAPLPTPILAPIFKMTRERLAPLKYLDIFTTAPSRYRKRGEFFWTNKGTGSWEIIQIVWIEPLLVFVWPKSNFLCWKKIYISLMKTISSGLQLYEYIFSLNQWFRCYTLCVQVFFSKKCELLSQTHSRYIQKNPTKILKQKYYIFNKLDLSCMFSPFCLTC